MALQVSIFVSVNIDTVEENIVSELRLSKIQSKVYVLVVKTGKMSASDIAKNLNISEDEANQVATSLIQNGGFIDITKTEFESCIQDLLLSICIEECVKGKIFHLRRIFW
jgi:Sugar-specific transcriptional regulator TrmB.